MAKEVLFLLHPGKGAGDSDMRAVMKDMTVLKLAVVPILFFSSSCSNDIPEDWDEPVNLPAISNLLASMADWSKPYPALRVVSNLYVVGTYDLGVFLITSDEGHILINTGVEGSFHQIDANISSLGFRTKDIKILLSMQAHWDHVAEFARIKHLTEAEVWATAKDAILLEDGGQSDPNHPLGSDRYLFRPVAVERIISEGDVIELGGIRLQVHDHPGHTPGSTSYSMKVVENGATYNVVIVNMGTINPGMKLLVDPTYPGIDDDFRNTFAKQKAIKAEIWVSSHSGFYNLHQKYGPGQPYDPATFYDPKGYLAAISYFERKYLAQRREELNQ